MTTPIPRIFLTIVASTLVSSCAQLPPVRTAALNGVWYDAPPMIHARSAHAVVGTGDAIYAIGGTGEGGRPVLEVERFDGNEWRDESRLPGEGLNAPTASVIGRRIYIVGGSRQPPTSRARMSWSSTSTSIRGAQPRHSTNRAADMLQPFSMAKFTSSAAGTRNERWRITRNMILSPITGRSARRCCARREVRPRSRTGAGSIRSVAAVDREILATSRSTILAAMRGRATHQSSRAVLPARLCIAGASTCLAANRRHARRRSTKCCDWIPRAAAGAAPRQCARRGITLARWHFATLYGSSVETRPSA